MIQYRKYSEKRGEKERVGQGNAITVKILQRKSYLKEFIHKRNRNK